MPTATETVTADLASIVGETHVFRDPEICAGFAARGVTPNCAVFPAEPEEVAAILRYASERGLVVIPCRNATKLSIGNPPLKYDIALSLKAMNNVWHYEPSDLTISVEAGMKFGEIQNYVGRNHLWLPLDPEGGARASIGGILATNSAGPLRYAFGAPRDMTLGIKIATAEGKIIKAGGRVVKNVAGYDVSKLMIGSFGTLGVIVEANFKLFPLPSSRASFIFALRSLADVRNLRRELSNSSLPIMRMALLVELAATWVRDEKSFSAAPRSFELWVEAAGSEKVLQRVRLDAEQAAYAAGAKLQEFDEHQASGPWEKIADFRRLAISKQPKGIVVRVSVLASHQEHFVAHANQYASSLNASMACLSQPGVGIVQVSLWGTESLDYNVAIKALVAAAKENGGTLVNVDGEPKALQAIQAWAKCGDDLAVMQKLKKSWDPNNILSPGRFAGGL